MARTAEVKRDARIGEAEAKKDAQIKEAIAEEERMAARYLQSAKMLLLQPKYEIIRVLSNHSFFQYCSLYSYHS